MFLLASALVIAAASPNGQVRFELASGMTYSVKLAGRTVIEPSRLSITVDGVDIAAGAKPGRTASRRIRESFPWLGAHAVAVADCNEFSLPVSGRIPYTVQIRACNDGVAFRTIVPGAGSRVPDEATVFRPAAGSTVWHHDLEGHYEALHKRSRIEEIPPEEWLAPPVTFRLPDGGGYASITEAGLAHYAGMALQADGHGALHARLGHAHPPGYPFRLRYKDDIERLSKPAAVSGTITTPWRVILTGSGLNSLVNADLVWTLAPPPDPKIFPQGAATPWAKPGRAVWKYLDGGRNDAATVREFSRLAGRLGFEYQVVEGFWQKWTEEELRDVIADSRRHGVGLWLWKHSRELRDPESRSRFFGLCRRVGAAGVKIDFFDHEAKEVVELYETLLREAAARRLLVNFHGANKPTGGARTWPNELTREAVRGMESRKSPRARHDATIPFTRLLAGPADYTPVHFGERRNDTTWAHQIATAVIFTSPLLTYAAHPAAILANPAVDVIRAIPAVWDETRVLPGSEIGEAAVFARRKADEWFIAAVNGETARRVEIRLDFLRAGSWKAQLVRDAGAAGDSVSVETLVVRKGARWAIDLLPGGGFTARISRQ